MGFFTGLTADDHCGHFNALQDMLEARYNVAISRMSKRTKMWDQAETAFEAPLGQEVKSFLGFIADIAASGVFEAVVGGKGKMRPTEPCRYRLELRSLNNIDSSLRGISFMETRDARSYFSILTAEQAFSPCPVRTYGLRKYKAGRELVSNPYADVSLISFALRFFGKRMTQKGRALSSASSQPEAFHLEARRCLGVPTDLGGDVYFYEAENAEILVRPIADIGINVSILDVDKASPVSDELLSLVAGGIATFKA